MHCPPHLTLRTVDTRFSCSSAGCGRTLRLKPWRSSSIWMSSPYIAARAASSSAASSLLQDDIDLLIASGDLKPLINELEQSGSRTVRPHSEGAAVSSFCPSQQKCCRRRVSDLGVLLVSLRSHPGLVCASTVHLLIVIHDGATAHVTCDRNTFA
jgi:hypothetical protein